MLRLRVSPTVQISVALAAMACALVILADALLGSTGGGTLARDRERRVQAESLAEAVALQLNLPASERNRRQEMGALIDRHLKRDESIARIEVLRSGGGVIARTLRAESTQVPLSVPLSAGAGGNWGELSMQWSDDGKGGWAQRHPLLALGLFMLTSGALGFWLYVRKVLQYLDPNAVVPDRIRTAFDSLVEGVAILDPRGRVVMTNHSFRRFAREARRLRSGQHLGVLEWMQSGRRTQAAELPWVQSMARRNTVTRVPMTLNGHAETTQPTSAPGGAGPAASGPQGRTKGQPLERELEVSCSPILDGYGEMRGCLVSFADVTEIARANRQLRTAMTQLEVSRREVERQNAILVNLATRDSLTGCLNRRAFSQQAGKVMERALRGEAGAVMLVIDIDFFKSVNDRFGHAVGDEVIKAVAGVLDAERRPNDLLSRHGGEEFCLLLDATHTPAGLRVAERMRCAIEAMGRERFAVRHAGLTLTISVGCAALDSTPGLTLPCALPGVPPAEALPASEREKLAHDRVEQLIDLADRALYRAKRSGRNRVCLHDPALDNAAVQV